MRSVRKRGSPWRVFTVILVLWASGAAQAENVDPGSDGSQYAWNEKAGWLNAEPQGEGGPGVQVTDTELTGWIWAGDAGWISLSCQNTSSCGANDYGVANDGKGNLSGRAWGEHLGWISFRTSGGSDCCSANGTPGCTDSACEAAVCPANLSCCNDEWDSNCAAAAAAEPACSPACAADPFGVRIHGFTGEFSGFAWTEHDGWINFGTAPVAQSHQIETSWRCPDPDSDGICTASDPCGTYDASGRFGQTLLAVNPNDFIWSVPADWELAKGAFATSADIGMFVEDSITNGSGTGFTDSASPGAGTGYWYLMRPDCPTGSYSTGSPYEQEGRDPALIPCCDETGNRFVDCGDGTIQDTETGLFWLKNAICFNADWTNANAWAAGLADGQCRLTDGSQPGDWRLPTLECPSGLPCSVAAAEGEFASVFAPSCPAPFILDATGAGCWSEGDPFSAVQPSNYWSETTVAGDPSLAWNADLGSGNVNQSSKVNTFWVGRSAVGS